MSFAWEVTDDDIESVLSRHGRAPSEDSPAFSALSVAVRDESGRVETAALRYTDMDDQTASACDEIENILLATNHLTGPKRFSAP
jgi:hypothetical protein